MSHPQTPPLGRRALTTTMAGLALGALATSGPAQAAPNVVSRPLRITVAAADAPAYIRAEANYVCTGSNDHAVINLAIAAAATGPIGGSSEGALNSVQLSGGVFNCSGSVLLRSGVDLMGAGPFATVLRAVGLNAVTGAGAGAAVIKLLDPNTHGCGVHNLTLDGNDAAGGSCSGLIYSNDGSSNPAGYPETSPDPDCYAHDLYVVDFDGVAGRSGLCALTDMRGTFFHSCNVRRCSADGVVLDGTPDSHIDRIHIGGCGRYGINVTSGNNKVVNCKAYYCDVAGMFLAGSRSTYSALEVQDSAVGFHFHGDGSPVSATALTADTCRDDGIIIGSWGLSLSGFQVLHRPGGRYASPTLRGLSFSGAPGEVTAIGRVAGSVSTKLSGAPGANSFVRIAGGTLYSVG